MKTPWLFKVLPWFTAFVFLLIIGYWIFVFTFLGSLAKSAGKYCADVSAPKCIGKMVNEFNQGAKGESE